MTYKPIKTETGWGVMLKDGKMLTAFQGRMFFCIKRFSAKDAVATFGGKVVRLRVTYEVGV